MFVGNPQKFAIESEISEAYASESQFGLGYFNIHILGKRYGVCKHDASLLGCSYSEVVQRVERRGEHTIRFDGRSDGYGIVKGFLDAYYGERVDPEAVDEILLQRILWAPDGDAAFDDGGHVFHFDVCDKVRLLGCVNNQGEPEQFAELWLQADDFYGVLIAWRDAFFESWRRALVERLRTH
ncbi:Imm42 family immunity protein [Agrobacterium sp. LR_9]|uniref:Imm42 family immunity protein n=1 Tax=Agrobacterium sp. LR_9 TaxID=3055787 RepID=UPI0035BFB831